MSVDLDFWKYQDGVYLDNAMVYQQACCDQEAVEGLQALPAEDILEAVAAAFPEWGSPAPFHYEREGGGSFHISTTPQTVRFDCCSMERMDMKRFSAMMAGFGCPLYDPQLGARFDQIHAFLEDEAGEYRVFVEGQLSSLFPGMEIVTEAVSWEESARRSKTCPHIQYNAAIHRGKAQTKVTSFMRFGSGWANRSCQCKTALLADPDDAVRLLEELLRTSIGRVVKDFLDRTYYQ